MATNPDKWHIPRPTSSVIDWLLDSDPSIRWQALRALQVLDWYSARDEH